jgi:hypothetical protein
VGDFAGIENVIILPRIYWFWVWDLL